MCGFSLVCLPQPAYGVYRAQQTLQVTTPDHDRRRVAISQIFVLRVVVAWLDWNMSYLQLDSTGLPFHLKATEPQRGPRTVENEQHARTKNRSNLNAPCIARSCSS